MVSRVERRVIFAETDAMRIVYYANYLQYFEIGRAEFFREFLAPFTDYIERGLYLAVTETAVRYHKPARYDDRLVIETRLTRLGLASLKMSYRIEHKESKDLISTGMTGHALLDEKGRVLRFDKDFRESLKTLVSDSPHDVALKVRASAPDLKRRRIERQVS